MSFLSQFFSGGSKNTDIGTYGVGLATGFSSQIPVDIMLIGGGGGGGSVKNTAYGPTYTTINTGLTDCYQGGGGGAGRALVYNNCIVNTGITYPITVGAGGAANQRGGTSIFGILKSGGGGRGAGFNPDGTPITPVVQDFWGGSEGGKGVYNTAITPLFEGQDSIQTVPIDNQGTQGQLFFTDLPSSLSVFATPGPNYSPLGRNFLTNAQNIFKQSVNSVVFSSPLINGQFNYNGAIPGGTSMGISGQGGVGGCYPHYTKFPETTPIALVNSAYNFALRTTTPGLSGKDFIADFFYRAGSPAFLSDGEGGRGAGGIAKRYGYVTSPINGPSINTFFRVTPYNYTGTIFSPEPNNNLPRNFDFVRTSDPSSTTPTYNFFDIGGTVGSSVNANGGNSSYSIAVSSPGAVTPFVPQTGKLVSWLPPSGFETALAGGSPGNGGGGGGGSRVAPIILQGTVSVSRPSPGFGNFAPAISTPYAVNISGTPTAFATGGAGGSGSVWVIYPTDYAAATVVGNTAVPSPPAFRIYRWDGAGSITFNAS